MSGFSWKAGTAVALVLAVSGCIHLGGPRIEGSGVQASEERDVGEFDAVSLRGSTDVWIRVGETCTLTVEADDNLLEHVVTRVRGGTLLVENEGNYTTRLGLKVTACVPSLEGVSVTGSGDLYAEGVATGNFEASVTGSGDIEVVGTADDLDASVTGSGDLNLAGLDARRVRAKIMGSGDIDLRVSEALDASIMGSGDIRYRGDPPEIERSIAGSGDIRAL